MRVLVDGDILVYRTAFSCEKKGELTEPEHVCIGRLNHQIEMILERCNSLDYICYLTGSDNFRKEIYPEYKANRVQPKPLYYELCREHLLNVHKAEMVNGMEADDAMGIEATRDLSKHIIASIDKDMLQIPCKHYNWVKDIFIEQTEYDAHLSFYAQLLMGDSTDNVPGIPKIGPANALRILDGAEDEREMFNRVVDTYRERYEGDWQQALLCHGRLLWILREPLQDWGEVVNEWPVENGGSLLELVEGRAETSCVESQPNQDRIHQTE